MSWTLLWLVASLAFASLASLADGVPLQVMSAPNLLRVGTAENIFVECQDCTGEDMRVEIKVMNFPSKSKTLAMTPVTLTSNDKFQGLGQITIPAGDFDKDPNMKQYVYLQALFPDQLLEKIVLVSFQSGYIFIQTDKTLYTPDSRVHYRMFAVTPRMEPVERDDETQSALITTEIVTPDGITLPIDRVSLKSGIHSGIYKLTEIVRTGMWKVVAKFVSNPQQSYSAEFEVKEYVLPSFEVKLTPEIPFFYVDSESLTVNIRATYLFNEEVDGMAYAVFGVMQEGKKTGFPGSVQRMPIERGNGVVTLKKEHITQTFGNILELVGRSIFVAVSVLTDSGSEMVEAELRSIQIVTSPYTIHFKKTPKYYKPGMSFDVAVEVLNPDGTPAPGVPVVVDPGQVNGVTVANGIVRLAVNPKRGTNALTITAKTKDPGITKPERQASATMVALPYTTSSNNYIHIGVDAAEVTLGQDLKISFVLNRQENPRRDITYLILSKGQLVKYGRQKTEGQLLIAEIIRVTKEMLPSFRIIAYYHTDDNKVVSDSLWVEVKDSCMGSLKLESSRPAASYEPRRMFGLKVTGDPEATVGLVAVDKGVYVLNNKHRLTQKKVWDIVEKSDTGCTPGGGRNSMSVFYDAGLLFESSTASGTPYRQELKCPVPSRKKRTASRMAITTSLVSQYGDQLQRECCLDGMKDISVSYSCERRSEYIVDDLACVEAFLHCCKEMEGQQAERREDSLLLARSEEDEEDDGFSRDEIVTRTQFRESWLWLDVKLPACQTSNCVTTSTTTTVPLLDSITTWQFTGISLSRTHGICVGEPLEVIVRKDFFIDLRLPYSAVRGEQLEIRAILHNHSPDNVIVRVDFIEQEHVCSVASKRRKYRQEVKLGPLTTRSVPFIIIPMKEGQHPIHVKAVVKDSSLNDGIMKKLQVVPEGVLVKTPHVVTLNPTNDGVDGLQEVIINSGIPRKDLVPNTPTSTQIFVTGREQVSTLVGNAISGNSMGTLICEPSGCGEQNLAVMTLPVIATTYLDKTNQWETVGFEKRYEALQHIQTGYHNELYFRDDDDGSFAVFIGSQSSTWLTAYVVKVFAMAHKLVDVPSRIICDAVKFLVLNTQQPDGSFREVGYVYSSAMRGDVEGRDSDASMTAFCLIAMQESRTLCDTSVNSLQSSIDKAVAFLERRLPSLTYSYAVAMTSYALANEKKLNQDILYNFVSESSHWQVPKGPVYTMEATAYALLALVKAEAFEAAKPVVRWFNQQQQVGGGYGSTQATIMVYQAVAEYWANAKEPEYDLDVNILLPGKSKFDKYNFNQGNHYASRSSRIQHINQNVKVTANGTGEATVTVVAQYYALPKEKESDCQKFNLSVQLLPAKLDEDEDVYKLRIDVFFKDNHRDATMSILDIGLLTGFTVNTKDLDSMAKGHANIISKYEVNTALSEKGSLIIYLDKVSHTRPEEITFRIHQKFKVGVLQPAAVSVYEYYNKKDCVKYYHPERRAGQLQRLCKNDVCACAEENCSKQKEGRITHDERKAKACESTLTSKTDFVYKVRVEKVDSLSTDIYTMRILEVIKEATYDMGARGNLRTFLSFPYCRKSLGLETKKNYLIMLTANDIVIYDRKHANETYPYILGQDTWIEYWPTDTECQSEEHRSTCLKMEEMLGVFVCPK